MSTLPITPSLPILPPAAWQPAGQVKIVNILVGRGRTVGWADARHESEPDEACGRGRAEPDLGRQRIESLGEFPMALSGREELFRQYMEPLLAGRRQACRHLVRQAIFGGTEAETIYHGVLWPAMEEVQRLYREDLINTASEHMATRINRLVADQLQSHLPQAASTGKRVLVTSAPDEPEDLGGQMCADLFEADGWDVYFLGGGVPDDEVLSLVGQLRPDILLIFGTQPRGIPGVRRMIDRIRDIDAHPTMNIMISGGVFNRADGLWEEINADLFAPTATEALRMANAAKPKEPTARPTGPVRKRRRRRRSPYLELAEGRS